MAAPRRPTLYFFGCCSKAVAASTPTSMVYSLDAILSSPKAGIKRDYTARGLDRRGSEIFIQCPTTGQPIPTGLHTGTVVFDILSNIEMRMHCPACREDHTWNCTTGLVKTMLSSLSSSIAPPGSGTSCPLSRVFFWG